MLFLFTCKLSYVPLYPGHEVSNDDGLSMVFAVRTLISAWLVAVNARFFLYHTQRSYEMAIGDDFLGAGSPGPSPGW